MLLSMMTKMLALFLKVDEPACFPPPLSLEEERECFERCRQGDEAAREKLILHNLRLVAHIVKKYYITSKNQEDLISIGTIGLIKAVDSFDASNGARFATYAGRCLQNAILSQRLQSCRVGENKIGWLRHRSEANLGVGASGVVGTSGVPFLTGKGWRFSTADNGLTVDNFTKMRYNIRRFTWNRRRDGL